MNSKAIAGTAALLALVLISARPAMDFVYSKSEPIEYRNGKVCRSLKPGINKSELVAALGSPTQSYNDRADPKVLRMHFKSISIQSTQSWAMIDGKTDKVIALNCNGEGPFTWELVK